MIRKIIHRLHNAALRRQVGKREAGQAIAVYALILTGVFLVGAVTLNAIDNGVNNKMEQAEERIVTTDVGSDNSFVPTLPLQYMVVVGNDYNAPYDGSAHMGTVGVTTPSSGYSILYGTSAGGITNTSAPTRTAVGTTTV